MIGVVYFLLKIVKHKYRYDFISKKAACTGFSKVQAAFGVLDTEFSGAGRSCG